MKRKGKVARLDFFFCSLLGRTARAAWHLLYSPLAPLLVENGCSLLFMYKLAFFCSLGTKVFYTKQTSLPVGRPVLPALSFSTLVCVCAREKESVCVCAPQFSFLFVSFWFLLVPKGALGSFGLGFRSVLGCSLRPLVFTRSGRILGAWRYLFAQIGYDMKKERKVLCS